MHNLIKRCFLIFFLCLLLFLFTVPRLYLNRLYKDVTALTLSAAATVHSGGDPAPQLAALAKLYQQRAPVLRTFLSHTAVDEAGAAISVLAPLAEREALLSALNAVNAGISHLCSIEAFSLDALL